MINTTLFSTSDEKLQKSFPPSNIAYEKKIRILHNLRARIICEDNSLQGLLTFVPSSVVPDNHPLFNEVAYTNGDEMFFADKFFSMEIPIQCAIIIHEMLHIVFRHCTRGRKRIASLYNIASDCVINESIGFKDQQKIDAPAYLYLNKKDVVSLESVYDECNIPSSERKHFSQWTSESLYEYLIKNLKEKLEKQLQDKSSKKSKSKNKSKTQESSSSSGNSSLGNSTLEQLEKEVEELAKKLADKHKLFPGDDIKEGETNKEDPTNSQIDDFKWTQRYNRAKAQSNNSRNSILGKVNPDVYQPQIPWHVELRKYLVKRCMPLLESSWNKPSRRMGSLPTNNVYMPGLLNKKGIDKMLVVIDTSGSCFNEEELTMFCTEIQGVQTQTNVEIALLFADTEVRGEYLVKSDGTKLLDKIKQGWIKASGGGGTDMITPLLYGIKKYSPILSVIASDGYCEFPSASQIRNTSLLWVINTLVEVPKGSGKALYINKK